MQCGCDDNILAPSNVEQTRRARRNLSHDPNFICIGAQKAGTTWLKNMLDLHPDVFVPERKELYFFSRKSVYAKGIDWYRSQFASAGDRSAIGELTADYLWTTTDPNDLADLDRNSNVPALVRHHYPDQKFIVILRDPVDRAKSAFYHHIRARRIPPTASIVEAGKQLGILSMGYYAQHLENWFAEFGEQQFLLLVFEDDVKANPSEGIRKVFKFLEIDDEFVPPRLDKRVHVASNHLYMRINYYFPLLGQLFKNYPSLLMGLDWKIRIGEEDLHSLAQHFSPHNERLSQMLGRSLPWKMP